MREKEPHTQPLQQSKHKNTPSLKSSHSRFVPRKQQQKTSILPLLFFTHTLRKIQTCRDD